MSQLSQRLSLDLANAFASNGKVLANLFERVLGAGIAEAKSHLDDFFLSRS